MFKIEGKRASYGNFKENFSESQLALNKNKDRISISDEFEVIAQEMEIMGKRLDTIQTYRYQLHIFMRVNEIKYIDEINREAIFNYLSQENISDKTKSNRMKCLRTTLNKFQKRGLLKANFWDDIRIQVDEEIKVGANEQEVFKLLNLLDFNIFTEFRDACAILLMWETGARVGTLGRLEFYMIDFDGMVINFSAQTMKNRKAITLPISEDLRDMLLRLMRVNADILDYLDIESDLVFITENGKATVNGSNSVITKRITDYSKRWSLKTIKAHNLRRGFAKRLLEKGVSVPVISKALNHSDLAVTTKYPHIDKDEVIDSIRNSWEVN